MSTFTHVNGAAGCMTVSARVAGIHDDLERDARHLVLVGVTVRVAGATTFSVGDGSNTYTQDAIEFANGDLYAVLFRSVVTVGGNSRSP